MRKFLVFAILFSMLFAFAAFAKKKKEGKMFKEDTIKTSAGDLKITFIGHGTLMFTFGEKVIHVDPVSREADYNKMPKADLILVTHEHGDHLDPKAIEVLRKEKTEIVLTRMCSQQVLFCR